MTLDIGGHHRARGRTNEWLTPPRIIEALGGFDLDPCAPVDRPWPTAADHYTVADDGLSKSWFHDRVWMNPPYGPECAAWLKKLSAHGNGIALVFARTETDMFHGYVWPIAHGILFLRGRLHFYDTLGNRADANAGAPSVLIAYGKNNARALQSSGLDGHYIELR